MDPVTVALLSIAISCIFGLVLRRYFRHFGKRLPPGPRGIPIFGCFFSIPKRDYIYFQELSQKYGDLVFLNIGSLEFLYLNTTRAMREALITQGDVFSGRLINAAIDKFVGGAGILFKDGREWQEHRRFTLKALRDLGAGRPVAEQKTLDEFDSFLNRLTIGKAIEVHPSFFISINNVIAQLVLGERTGTEDPEFERFQEHLKTIEHDESIAVTFPVIFPIFTNCTTLLKLMDFFYGFGKFYEFSRNFIRGKIDKHEAALKELGEFDNQEPKDVCDALLIERARIEKESPGEPHTFTDIQLILDLFELFMAGTETTSNTLNWAVFLMSIHPDVQTKVQAEIDSVIGRSRKVTMKDRLNLPFVNATIDEILRVSTIVPSGIVHRCREDTELMGYFIPKDTMVITNIYAIHRDKEVWERPDDFYPEHFLTPDRNYKPSDHLLPFSMGRRACLGENLARMEIFIFFVSIFQHLDVRLADPTIDLTKIKAGKGGGVRRLSPHEVIFTYR